jgi:hypothetical protein
MNGAQRLVACVGCGALVPDIDGPTHPYIGASPGCWQAYGELQAKTYNEAGIPPILGLAVDVYAVQHPGVPGRRSSQSVAVHLMVLCLVLDRGAPPERAFRARRHFTHRAYSWLEPPASPGVVTVLDVLAARDPAEHAARVERWARSVWDAWSAHHDTVRRWLERGPAP